jgi:hypothetical protein
LRRMVVLRRAKASSRGIKTIIKTKSLEETARTRRVDAKSRAAALERTTTH